MLEVKHIFKTYEGKPLLDDISFTVDTGETVCLLGASGSGKSTLLRIIAGLENPDSGSVSFDRQDLRPVPAHLRDFGLVFQDYALFPHLTVRDNVAFGLKMRRRPPAEIEERVVNALGMVDLARFRDRAVTELSGGEQQRVALARALAPRPRLLMFDEPLGALDRTLREDLLKELRSILHHTDIPAIYVTHDQEEAFALADRLLILQGGQIVRQGTPAEVWDRPGSAFVAGFLGLGNIMEGEVRGFLQDGNWRVGTPFGDFDIRCEHEHRLGDKVHLLARPMTYRADENTAEDHSQGMVNSLNGTVSDILFQQDRYKVTLHHGLYVYLQKAPRMGERIDVQVKVECLA